MGGIVVVSTLAANLATFETQHPSALKSAALWWRDACLPG